MASGHDDGLEGDPSEKRVVAGIGHGPVAGGFGLPATSPLFDPLLGFVLGVRRAQVPALDRLVLKGSCDGGCVGWQPRP